MTCFLYILHPNLIVKNLKSNLRETGLMRVSIDDNNNIVHNDTVILKSLNNVSITDYIKEM